MNYQEAEKGFSVILLGGNQNNKVQYQKFDFIKKGKEFWCKNFILKGFVIPKEYKYDENDLRYYDYEKVDAVDGNTR